MKFTKSLAFLLLYVAASMSASLASAKTETKPKTTRAHAEKYSRLNSKLGTSFKFDGSSLRGKYQSSMGTAVAVENDKYLDDLLSGRKHFEDRLKDDNNRN